MLSRFVELSWAKGDFVVQARTLQPGPDYGAQGANGLIETLLPNANPRCKAGLTELSAISNLLMNIHDPEKRWKARNCRRSDIMAA